MSTLPDDLSPDEQRAVQGWTPDQQRQVSEMNPKARAEFVRWKVQFDARQAGNNVTPLRGRAEPGTPTPDPAQERPKMQTFTAADLQGMEFPPLAWAVPGLMPEGFGILTGAPKVGKSWLVLDLALAVAGGTTALGKVHAGDPRPVLYLALEDGPRRLAGRVRHLIGEEAWPERLEFRVDMPDNLSHDLGQWFEEHSDQQPVVILDTLGKVLPPAAPGEGAYQRDYRAGSALKAHVDAHPGSTLIVVHHVNKMPHADWTNSTSGTNGLNGSADWTLNVHRDRNSGEAKIRVTGRDVREDEYAATVTEGRWELNGMDLVDAAQRAREAAVTEGLGPRAMEVVSIVNEHPEGIGPAQVGRLAELSTEQAGTYLTRALNAGRIAKAGRGKYTPVECVESVEFEESSAPNSTDSTHSTPPLEEGW